MSRSNYQIHIDGNSKDEQARKRVTFLMKTPMKDLVNSRIYKKLLRESELEHGRSWWYFTNVTIHNRRTPWLWQFKEEDK